MTRLRTSARAAIAVGALLGAVAVLHTPLGRPILGKFAGSRGAGCPFNAANASPAALESSRVAGLASLRDGARPRAKSRPALAFALARTTRDDVRAWAAAHGVACKEELGATALRCADVAPDAVGEPTERTARIEDLFFRFDPRGALVALDAMHAESDGAAAVELVSDAGARLQRELGDAPGGSPPEERGAAYLASAPLAQTSLTYRYRDYAADVSATNFAGRGVVVREQYRAIPE